MPSFSPTSLKRLGTCDKRLQNVLFEAIKLYDFTVIEGYRGKEAQDKAFAEGKSKLRFPHGNHNQNPSRAVDIYPYPVSKDLNSFESIERFQLMALTVLKCAKELGIKIRWGADWDSDGRSDDEKFLDYPHFELVG